MMDKEFEFCAPGSNPPAGGALLMRLSVSEAEMEQAFGPATEGPFEPERGYGDEWVFNCGEQHFRVYFRYGGARIGGRGDCSAFKTWLDAQLAEPTVGTVLSAEAEHEIALAHAEIASWASE
jgi:hypothetical protein